MRDDKLVSPVISTYAIGGHASAPRRGAGLALPVIVVLGTASVAAIVSVSFEGETPIVADQRAVGDSSPKTGYVTQSADEPGPKVSVRLDDASLAADAVPVRPAEKAAPPNLPMLSVLQPKSAMASPRPAVAPPNPAPHRASRPSSPVVRQGDSPPATDADCDAGCLDAEAFQPSVDSASGGVALDSQVSDESVPLAADDQGAFGGPPDRTEPLAADVALAAVEAPEGSELEADTRPVLLGETEEGLVAGGPDLALSEVDPPEAVPTDATLAQVEAGRGPDTSQAERQPAAPTAGQDPTAADAGTTIPQHLARIGERYAGASTTAPVRGAAENAVVPSDQAALVESTVAVDLGETAGSGVIVQDDELVAIRLGELVSLLEDRLDHPLYVWLSSSSAASKFVTAQTLAAAGIRTHYDPERRQLVISTGGE